MYTNLSSFIAILGPECLIRVAPRLLAERPTAQFRFLTEARETHAFENS